MGVGVRTEGVLVGVKVSVMVALRVKVERAGRAALGISIYPAVNKATVPMAIPRMMNSPRDGVAPAMFLFTGIFRDDQLFFPTPGVVDRERRDRVIRRQASQHGQAAFRCNVLRVQPESALKAIDAFFLSVHRRAQPDPVSGIVLIGLEHARQQVAGSHPVTQAERFDGFAQDGILTAFKGLEIHIIGHKLSLA